MDKSSSFRLNPPRLPSAAHPLLPSHKRNYTPSTEAPAIDPKKRRVLTQINPQRTSLGLSMQKLSTDSSSVPAIERMVGVETLSDSHRPLFKARPVPKSHYQPSICIKSSDRPLTVPAELSLFTHVQSRSSSQCSEMRGNSVTFRARPMPDFSQIMTPKMGFVPTEFQPFPLRTEERGFEKSIALHHKLHMEAEEQQRMMQFTARPLPVFPPPQSLGQSFSPTVPQPFQFHPHPKVNLPEFPQVNAFRAKPMPDFSRPFQPVLEGKCTQPMDVELNSDLQSVLRAQFDLEVRQKQAKEEEAGALIAQQKAEMELEEVKKLRKSLEFKARPLPPPSNFVVYRSEHPSTIPKMPQLMTEVRGRGHCSEGEPFNPNVSDIQSSASTVSTDMSMVICEEGGRVV